VSDEVEDRRELSVSSPSDWTTLAAKLLDDLSRMVHAEISLAELNLREIVQSHLDQMLATLIVGGLMMSAAVCLLAAMILLLHRWMEWWQSFAVAAVICTFVALIIHSRGRLPETSAQ
jgi:CBS domain containing-hemolysin-like protein